MIRVVIDVAAPEGLAVKEQLAMLLERYGDTRVVSVTPTGPGRNFEMSGWIIRRSGPDGTPWPTWASRYECLTCGLKTSSPSNFCPNCGADLRCRDESD